MICVRWAFSGRAHCKWKDSVCENHILLVKQDLGKSQAFLDFSPGSKAMFTNASEYIWGATVTPGPVNTKDARAAFASVMLHKTDKRSVRDLCGAAKSNTAAQPFPN